MHAHWKSYSLHEGPGHGIPNGRGCMVSVVLDDIARHQFSAIRLLIVCKKSQRAKDLKISRCSDTTILHISQSGAHHSSRCLLTRCHNTYRRDQDLSASRTPHLPVCTVAFEVVDATPEVVDAGGDVQPSVTLVSCSPPAGASCFQVVYDHTHPYDQADPSLLVFLTSSASFNGIPPDRCSSSWPQGIPAHSVRVLPVTGRQQFRFALQPEIVRRIVELAVGRKPVGWRAALLSYGLVCKSWIHVLDLFFLGLDGSYMGDMLDARRVARSLSVRPERGKLIHTFKQIDYVYKTPADIESWTEDWYSFLTILEHATSVNVVQMMYIPASVADMLAHVLSNLRQVHTCTITRPGECLDIQAIQTFIMNWEHLRVLNLAKWEHHDGLEPPSMRPHLQCKIEELKLQDGILTGPQLSRFAASPTPHLKVLELYGVSGLSNHDFFLFLLSVPTLTELSIAHSSLSRSSDEEERALDAAMPMLEALCSVRVESAHVSALALSRKPPLRQQPGAQKKHSEIVIEPATEELRLEDVEEAMALAAWDLVIIGWNCQVLDQSLVQRAVSAAEERGVWLICRIA